MKIEFSLDQPLREVKKAFILAVLEWNGGNRRKTSKSLKIGVRTLQRILKIEKISPEE